MQTGNVIELNPLTRPVRLYSVQTQGKWIKAEDSEAGNQPKNQGSSRKIKDLLTDCLTSTNLVILSGLGSSLSLSRNPSEPAAPTMQVLWNSVKSSEGVDLDKIKGLVNYIETPDSENIEVLLSKCKLALEFWPEGYADRGAVAKFVKTAENIIKEKCNFVGAVDLPIHQNFLRKIVRRSARKPRLKIFTTNYDRCFEVAASNARFVIVDGFSHSTPQSYDPIYFSYDIVRRDHNGESPDFVEGVFHLYKLHGSVDWTREKGEIVKKDNPNDPLLIYPRSSKYQQSFETPYIEMMAAFQAAVRQSETALIVIGFGFNDDHISGPIMSALQANLNLRVVVVDPFFYNCDSIEHELEPPNLVKPNHEKMAKLIAEGDGRIAFISATFEDFVEILPDLAAETDRERHAERFRKIREYENGAA